MHRTQILLDPVMYRRAVDEARARRSSLGEVVRHALGEHLARTAKRKDPFEAVLLDDPFDDPRPDKDLSTDVDHHLYGAPRKSLRRARRRRA